MRRKGSFVAELSFSGRPPSHGLGIGIARMTVSPFSEIPLALSSVFHITVAYTNEWLSPPEFLPVTPCSHASGLKTCHLLHHNYLAWGLGGERRGVA